MANSAPCYRYYVLAVLCSLAALTYLDRICIMRVQQEISVDLGFAELTQADHQTLEDAGLVQDSAARERAARNRATDRMGWVFAAFAAGYLLFEIPCGWLGDRWGARSVIFRIVLCWSIFTAATGGVKGIASVFSSNPGPQTWFTTMVIVRFLFGACEAGAYPNIARALGRWFPFGERARAQSFIWFSSRMGGAFAPSIIGGLMLMAGNWQRAFYILGGLGIIWSILFFLWFRNRPEEQPRVSAAEQELIRSSDRQPGNIYDDVSGSTLRWTAFFSSNLLAISLASFCTSFCFYFYITFLPRYLKDQFQVDYHQSQLLSGLPLLLGAFACLAGGMLSDWAIRRSGSRRWGRSLIPIIGWTAAAGCVLLVPHMHSAAAVVALLALGFMFQDFGVPCMWSVPADIGGRFTGTVGGWMNTAGCVAGMLSPLVAAKISIHYGWNPIFYLFGAVYLLGAVAWLRVDAGSPVFQPNKSAP